MAKNVTQLTETTTFATDDVLHIVDVANSLDKKIKMASIFNDKPYGELYLDGNATTTTLAVAGTYYNITTGGLTTTAGTLNSFTHTAASGRLTYTGAEDVVCEVSLSLDGTINATLGNNDDVRVQIYKNGVAAANMRIQGFWDGSFSSNKFRPLSLSGLVTMSENDYIEIFITQLNNTDGVLINYANLSIKTV